MRAAATAADAPVTRTRHGNRHALHQVVLAVLLVACRSTPLVAAEHHGRVTFGAVPVPGATVTALRGDERRATVTDQQGAYRFANIGEGVWTIRIEMLGFVPLTAEITVGTDAPASSWELALLPFDEIARGLPAPVPQPPEPARRPVAGRATGSGTAPPPSQTGFQ